MDRDAEGITGLEDLGRSPVDGASTRYRRRFLVLAAACALAVITYVHRAGFGSNSSELLADLRMDVRDLSWMTIAFTLAYGLFEIPWGRLGDRLGARNLLVIVALGGSLLTASVPLVALIPPFYRSQLAALLALRFLFGAFQAGTFPLLSRLMADWMPTSERGSAQGAIWMCSRAGGALAPLMMASLYRKLGDDWRLPLVIGAGLGVLWCLAVRPWLRDRPEGATSADPAATIGGRHAPAPWSTMLRSPNVWALWGMYGFLGFSGNFFLFLMPTYLQDTRGFPKETARWVAAAPFACGVVGCIAGGRLSDAIIRLTGRRRAGRSLVGASGLVLASGMILLSPWVADPRWLAVVYGLTFFGNDLAMGPAWAAAADIGERHAGTLAGAMNMAASLMAALMAFTAGLLFHSAKMAGEAGDPSARALYLVAPFGLFALSYALGALCWMRIDATETLPQSERRAS